MVGLECRFLMSFQEGLEGDCGWIEWLFQEGLQKKWFFNGNLF